MQADKSDNVTKNGLRTEKSVHFSFRELRTSVCLQVPCASVGTFVFVFVFFLFYVARNSRALLFFLSTEHLLYIQVLDMYM